MDEIAGADQRSTIDQAPEKQLVPKLAVLALAWLAFGHWLPLHFFHVLPRAVLDSLTLPTYNVICQVLTTAAGLSAAWLMLKRPAEALGLRATERDVHRLHLCSLVSQRGPLFHENMASRNHVVALPFSALRAVVNALRQFTPIIVGDGV